jgi:hypothetical protein
VAGWIAPAGCAVLAMKNDQKNARPEPADEAPDVPGFRTWGGIYGFAFAVFVVVVAALTLFTRAFA